jgi:RNA polymerase sigma factor (sigma-70 family)
MAHVTTPSVVRQIESLFDGGSVAGLTDRQLLERFTARRDAAGEAAFTALVSRHGPMVLGVCHQLLGDHHHAEDAFQAVFLVLARKAGSLRDPDLLGNWLYGVALRTARCAKLQLARRRRHEEGDAMRRSGPGSSLPVEPIVRPVEQPVLAAEQAEALHREVKRLPRAFRLPVVLCYFEGLSPDEAARRLRWPAGTVRSRLARARDKLRRGLTRRGVVLPATTLAAVLSTRSNAASISSPLCAVTTQAAMSFAAGPAAAGTVSASTMALAQEVLRAMLIHKLRLIFLTVLLLGAVSTGAGFLTHAVARKDELKKGLAVVTQPQRAAKAKAVKSEVAAPGRMIVVGRVLDSAGQPMAGVPVDVIGRRRKALVATDEMLGAYVLLARGATDADGRFRLDASRTSSLHFFDGYVLAAAPGFGWADLNLDAEQPAVEIRLRPEQVIRGRLVDVNGQPAAGVELRVESFGQSRDLGRSADIRLLGDGPPEGVRTWRHPIKTDAQGRFEFSGLGRGLFVAFVVHDLRFAPQWLGVATDDRDGPKEVTLALQPAKIIEGRVLAADTGQPIPNAVVGVTGSKCRTDAQGRFQANPAPGDQFGVTVFPPEGHAYLVSRVEFAWAKGAVKKAIDVKVPRGVLIRGKVTEEGSGRSLAGASVQYLAIHGNPENKGGWDVAVASTDDGSFQIVVPPGKGHLLVFGPTSDYLLEVIGFRMLHYGQSGGQRNYAHKIVAYEVKAGDRPHEINAVLRPGKAIKGRVAGPQGETIEHAAIITRLHIESYNTFWRGDYQLHARDGSFELHGLDPEQSVPVYFLDADHEWGATFEASGKLAGAELTVRLQPCGQAKARFVGPDGEPIAKLVPNLEILATPGRPAFSRNEKDWTELEADAAHMPGVDRKHYWGPNRPVTDTDGRITLPTLIPGALYRLRDLPGARYRVRNFKEFTVKPGETLDLGDIVVEKPPSS